MYLHSVDYDKYVPRLKALWPWEEVGLHFRSYDDTAEFTLGWGTTRGWFAWLTYLDGDGWPIAGENDEDKVAALAKTLAAMLFGGGPNSTDFALRGAGSHVLDVDGKIALLDGLLAESQSE